MRKVLVFILLAAMMLTVSACSQQKENSMVLVKGGDFVSTKSNYYQKDITIADFYISKYEVTQKEWTEVMGSNPSKFKGDDLPVEMVNWYDCVEYCNQRSIKEGLEPYYNIDKETRDPKNRSEYDDMKWTVTINEGANGYRLPTGAEWEYAASGGQLSKSYTYSGSDDVDEVAWTFNNSGRQYVSGAWSSAVVEGNKNQTHPVGTKKANELGLYDMSGNVREWCWDRYEDLKNNIHSVRLWRGGGWMGDVNSCEVTFQSNFEANGTGSDQGFRVCRNAG